MSSYIGPEEMPGWLVEHDVMWELPDGRLALTEFGHNLTHVLVEIHDRIPTCKPIVVAEHERLREAAQAVLDSAKPWLGRFEVGLDHTLLALRAALDNTEETSDAG